MKTDLDVESLRTVSRKAKLAQNKALSKEKQNEQRARKRLEQKAKRQGELWAKECLPDLIKEVKSAAEDGQFACALEIARLNGGRDEYTDKSSQEYLQAKAQAETVQKYFTEKKIRAELKITQWTHTEGHVEVGTWHDYMTSFKLLLSWE